VAQSTSLSPGGTCELEDGGPFTFTLEFKAECCPECGEPREPGLCPECGVEVSSSSEVAEMARARSRALQGIDSQLDHLIAGFRELPAGNIVVSNDQFARAVSDADLFPQLGAMTGIGHELEALNVNDPKVIGGELRQRMAARVGQVEKLLHSCEDLSRFDPRGPAAELRSVAVESGLYGARLNKAFIRILVAETIPAAREAEAEMQSLLGGFPYSERIRELLAQMEEWIVPDFDARAASIVGHPGVYSDEHGSLDVEAVFGAFSGPGAIEQLAERSRRYFAHLLEGESSADIALESLLIVPAIEIGTLDRPLRAHRIATGLFALLGSAADVAPQPVQELVEQTAAESRLVLEANEQIRRGAQLLQAGEKAGVVDQAMVVKMTMDAYKDLSETAFRTFGGLIVQLARIKRRAHTGASEPPTLGALETELAASEELVAHQLADGCDPALRNACAHSQYRWDEESQTVHDMRSDRRWTLEEVQEREALLSEAVAGAGAGYSCYLVGSRATLGVPQWVASEARGLSRVISAAILRSRGIDVTDVIDQSRTVVIGDDEPDVQGLMGGLASLSALLNHDDVIRVKRGSGEVVAEVEVSAFREWSEAEEPYKDLALFAPFLSNATRTPDPQEALTALLAVQINQVLRDILDSSDTGQLDAAAMLRVGDRFGYVVDSARIYCPDPGPEVQRILKAAERCRSAAFAATRDQTAGRRFLRSFEMLNEWVQERGVVWPPTLIDNAAASSA
jgi:hypothetical protein